MKSSFAAVKRQRFPKQASRRVRSLFILGLGYLFTGSLKKVFDSVLVAGSLDHPVGHFFVAIRDPLVVPVVTVNFYLACVCILGSIHIDHSIHIERECWTVLLVLFVKQTKYIFYLSTTQNLGAVAADLLYKSVPGLCPIISRAARYLPKPALNNILRWSIPLNFLLFIYSYGIFRKKVDFFIIIWMYILQLLDCST